MAKTEKTAKGGKSGKARERRTFWNRALQAPKVRGALASLKVDEKAFEKAYNATRKTRESAAFTPEDIKAFEAFKTHRNLDTLATALNCKLLTATTKLGKAMAQGLI